MNTTIGALSDLNTSDTDSVVNAINSVLSDLNTTIGALSDLNTSDTSSVVNAINELVNSINTLQTGLLITTPEIFGAIGDGNTDDTQAIINALSSAKIVYLSNSYLITNTITIPEGKSIIGKGTIIIDANETTTGIELSNNSYIEGITFRGINLNTYTSLGSAVYIDEKENCYVDNCKFYDIHLGYCIDFYHSNQFHANYNYIDGYAYGGICAILSCHHFEFNYNIVLNGKWTDNTNRYPIAVSGYYDINYGPAKFCKCNFNYIEDTTPLWEGIDSHGVCDCEIIGNKIKNVAYGIACGQPTNAGDLNENNCRLLIKDNEIEVTTAATGYMYGIGVTSDQNNDATEIEISNNTIIGNGTPGSYTDTTSGIWLVRRTNGTTFRNIIIKNNYVNGNNSSLAITCNPTEKLENILIENNIFSGGTSASRECIRFNNATASEYHNVKIIDNILNDHIGYDITGVSSYSGSELVEYHNNKDTGSYSRSDYITTPKSTLNANTKSCGIAGQEILCDANDDTLKFICKNTGSWYSVSGTAV